MPHARGLSNEQRVESGRATVEPWRSERLLLGHSRNSSSSRCPAAVGIRLSPLHLPPPSALVCLRTTSRRMAPSCAHLHPYLFRLARKHATPLNDGSGPASSPRQPCHRLIAQSQSQSLHRLAVITCGLFLLETKPTVVIIDPGGLFPSTANCYAAVAAFPNQLFVHF